MRPAAGILLLLQVATLLAAGCRHVERAELRAVEPIPERLLRAYRPRQAPFHFVLEPGSDNGHYYESFRFRFDTYSEMEGDFKQVVGTYYRTRKEVPGGRAPLLCFAPILAGAVDNYLACRVFAHWAAREGFSSFYVHQDEIILTADRDGIVLERLWRDSTLDNIKALDLLTQLPEVDAERLGSLGISLGAIRNVVLLAVEPRLRANVLCLGGAGLSKILATSRENLVLRYIRGREAADGITREQVGQDLDAFVRSDPAVFARYVANDRTLLFLGAIDNKVPYAAGLDLYEGLGRPEAYFILLGHYTGMLAAPFSASRMFAYLHARLDEGIDSCAAPPGSDRAASSPKPD